MAASSCLFLSRSAKQQELSLLKRSAGVRSAQRTPVLPTSASTSRLRVLGAMGTNVTGGAQSGSDTERKETQMVHGAQDEDEAHEGLPELVKGPSQLRAVRRRTIDPATMPRVPRTSGVPSLPTKAKMAAAPRASTAGEMPPPSVTRPLARRTSNVGPAPNANARIDKPAESASRRSSISSQTSVGTAGGDKTTTFAASTRTRASSTASTNKPTAGSATPVRRPVTRSTVAGAARPGTISRRASIASAAPSQTETETDRPLELGDLTVSDKENAGPGSAAGISHSASASRLSEVPGMESFMARRNRANGQRERRKTMVPA